MFHFELDGRAVLVTGANSGIGRQIALSAAEHGADVAVHYLGATTAHPNAVHVVLGQAAADEVVNAIRAMGQRAVAIEGDLLLAETPARLIAAAEEALGPLFAIVNNAANCELPDTLLEGDWEHYRRHFDVNVGATATLMREFARRNRPGVPRRRVVNISTDAARAFAGQVYYGASKAAIEALTRSTAIELGPLGITVNAIAPGPVQTGYISEALEAQVLPKIPLRRLGTPEDIANAVVFFLSDAADWITGQVIQVAGGHAL